MYVKKNTHSTALYVIYVILVCLHGTLNGANYYAIAIGGIGSNDNHYSDSGNIEDVVDYSKSI